MTPASEDIYALFVPSDLVNGTIEDCSLAVRAEDFQVEYRAYAYGHASSEQNNEEVE